MTNFERLTASPDALGDFLRSLPCLEGPWDTAFHELICAGCAAENCDKCPHEEKRNNPGWWLALEVGGGPAAAKLGTVVIDLDPHDAERDLTPEEIAELDKTRYAIRFYVSDSPELTEQEISEMEVSEEEKAARRFLAKNNPEKRVIEIGGSGGGPILLHGAAEVEMLIRLIRDHSREVYKRGR